MTWYGTVEIGGTKTDVGMGSSPENLQRERIQTSDPETTLGAVVEFFSDMDVPAIGVGAFGPLDLDPRSRGYGSLRSTPKEGWSGTPLLEILDSALDAVVVLDTDVNAAALGEGRWGATQGMADHVYMTVGTGIGAGVVVDGSTISRREHPEAGHVPVRRAAGDRLDGVCPFHGDCLEGLASGPALERRFGPPDTWPGNHLVVDLAAHYLAQGVAILVYTVAPERIVIGGGVSTLPGLHDRVRLGLAGLLGGYPGDPDLDLLVSRPGLGELSGLAGGLVLAETGGR